MNFKGKLSVICPCYLFIVIKYNFGFSAVFDIKRFSDSMLAKAAQHLSLTQMLEVMKYWLTAMRVQNEVSVYLLYNLVGLPLVPTDQQSQVAW